MRINVPTILLALGLGEHVHKLGRNKESRFELKLHYY